MAVSKETEEQVQQLQLIEHNLHNLLQQRQQFQAQLAEIESALEALQGTKQAYQMIGSLMIAADTETLHTELLSKKEVLNIRVKNIEKREESLKSKAKELQDHVLKELNENK